jgi:hypothetical protein
MRLPFDAEAVTELSGSDPDHDVRQFVVGRFPYLVITGIVTGQRAVVAVAHSRRRPGYWGDRLK